MVDWPRYGFYDGQVFRFDLDSIWPGERWMEGRWQRITPSEEEYDHVRQIGPVEAAELIGEADPDGPPPIVDWVEPDLHEIMNARGRYEDDEPLDLGEYGTLYPGEVFP